MIRTHSQMHRADKYLQHSSIIWPVWLNGWLFTYELSGSGSSPFVITYYLLLLAMLYSETQKPFQLKLDEFCLEE